jgi:hypothetical protein
VAGVVALAVFVAAGAFAFEALREPGGSTLGTTNGSDLVAHFFVGVKETSEELPGATLSYGGETIDGYWSSYCWSWGTTSGCADMVEPDLRGERYLQIPVGTLLRITGNIPRVEGGIGRGEKYPFDRVQSFGVIDGPIALDFVPGRYALSFFANWPEGDRSFYFPIEIVDAGRGPSTGADSPPARGEVVCRPDGAHVFPNVVVPQEDGVHLLIVNRSGATSYELLTSQHGTGVGGPLSPNGQTETGGISIEPGEVKVACLPTTSDTYLGQFTAVFTIEDPEGLWIPSEPTCDGKISESSTGLVYSVPTKAQILKSLTGVREGDEVVKPGYPETDWMVATLVVRRNGVVVANVWVGGGLHLKACDDSGIVLASSS